MGNILKAIQFLKNAWSWLNGKKTLIGAGITILAYVVAGLPLLAPFLGATTLAKWVGIGTTVVGLLHKAYKWKFGEEHP